jgi:hypothetical protein
VDGFSAPWWVLEELVESAAGFRELDLEVLDEYLRRLGRRVLDAGRDGFLNGIPR